MHELGIMSGVMDSVQQAANEAGAQRVLKISLSVGEMTEAIEDALRFAFEALRDEFNIAVIEGDIASSVDSEKIKEQGIAAVQINTGGACHLESDMIRRAVDVLDLDNLDLIIVENVGNLVCPTDFDLGENMKAMILSVPEGDDKPLKYPGVFQASKAIVLNKIDTLPVFSFDKEAFYDHIKNLNPTAPIFPISATNGEGVDAWAEWLAEKIRAL